MNTILFISDDFRSGDLLTFLRSHYKGRVKLAPDFDQGLKDVFDNRPSGVFIQSEISGISGETVARHIKTLLRTEAPRIILVHTAPLKPLGGKSGSTIPSISINRPMSLPMRSRSACWRSRPTSGSMTPPGSLMPLTMPLPSPQSPSPPLTRHRRPGTRPRGRSTLRRMLLRNSSSTAGMCPCCRQRGTHRLRMRHPFTLRPRPSLPKSCPLPWTS